MQGFRGTFCEENIDDCVDVNCNSGQCVDGIGTFTCDCEVGFSGELCEINIDNCEGINCNDGTCQGTNALIFALNV